MPGILGDVVHSVASFFARLSWLGRITVAGAAGATGIVAQDAARSPEDFMHRFGQFEAYWRLQGANGGAILLSSSGQDRLDRLMAQLTRQITSDLKQSKWELTQGYVPWTVAQMTVAVSGLSEVNTATVEKFVYGAMDASCDCWRELADKPEHVAATSWVLFSLGTSGLPMPEKAVDFVLANQKPDGWWSVYPATDSEKNACSYATAWALLALDRYAHGASAAPAADPARLAVVNEAIAKGRAWLERTKIPGEGRWYDYPGSQTRVVSASLSGLVLHVLHRLGDESDLIAADKAWMAALDTSVLDATASDSSDGLVIRPSGGASQDTTRHLRLPWSIIATVEAFPRGSQWERARALDWFERILRQNLVTEGLLARQWASAELLYALRRLRGPADIKPAT